MEAEWQLLEALASANQTVFAAITRSTDEFRVALRKSPAWIEKDSTRHIESEHELRYVYPRYYPTLPLEAYFARPVSHINVDPVTGFVCLWQDYHMKHTIVDAILITRAIMSWQIANRAPAHRMQQEECSSLSIQPLTLPISCLPLLQHRSSRQRLSSEFENYTPQESSFAFSDTE